MCLVVTLMVNNLQNIKDTDSKKLWKVIGRMPLLRSVLAKGLI